MSLVSSHCFSPRTRARATTRTAAVDARLSARLHLTLGWLLGTFIIHPLGSEDVRGCFISQISGKGFQAACVLPCPSTGPRSLLQRTIKTGSADTGQLTHALDA